MLDQKDIDYYNYGSVENEKFWRRLGGMPELKEKKILDFGCGHGALAIELARSGAKYVLGIDLEEKLLKFANENLSLNNSTYREKVNFKNINILENDIKQKFDLIVTKDTFEHSPNLPKILEKMYDLLDKGGKVYVGFGPLYNFYNGDHGRTNLPFPWLHLFFSENFIINRHNKKNNFKINKIQDLGLSKYSLKEYENFFENSKFKIIYYKTNLSDHPISPVFNLLSKIKFLKEYFTYNIYCILEK